VHVEVVANIKGLDETAALLFSLLGLFLLLRSIDRKQSWLSYAGAAAIFAACLSKENAVTFAATIPLVLVVFRKLSWKNAVTTSIPALAAVALYLVIRFAVIGSASSAPSQEFMNNPFLVFTGSGWSPMSFAEKMQVIFATFWKYATLVVLPYPLSHDYYPRQIESTSFTNPNTLMGMLIAVGLILAAVKGTLSKAPWAVGLVVTIASFSVVSNVVFPIGTTMGERFLFMPTFGIVLAVGALLGAASNTTLRKVGVVATGLFVIAGSVISVARTSAWRNNETLFFADITASPKSAKLNGACGGTYLTNALKSGSADSAVTLAQQAVPYLSRAIELHPTYGVCYYNRGTCYVILGKYREAVADARLAMQYNGDKKAAQKLLARALRDLGRQLGERENNIAGALEVLKESWTLYQEDAQTAHLLGIGHGISGKHAESLQWFQQAVEIDPQSPQYLRDLGTAYFLNGNAAKRDEFYAKASSIQPK
jgi:Flp pilus assembly protein TadD